ncbi:Bifunctional protein Aas [uncultured archaeon]|nr:Bifunctional protein Aas [uncultured archaeon]
MAYPISKIIFWPILWTFIKKIEGIDNLPNKPFIIAANHQSYIDGIILMFLVAWYKDKQLCFFTTNEKFTGPLWDPLFEHFGAIRVNGSLKKGLRAIRQGKCLGIFPEGGRTPDGKVQPLEHTGLGALALLTKAPIVPVGIQTYKFWNRHELMPNFKKNIVIKIGKPMKFTAKPTKKTIRETIKTIWSEVKKLA